MSEDILAKYLTPKKQQEEAHWEWSLKHYTGILQFIVLLSILSQIALWCTGW